ncbi:MAG: 1-acyl-sn-glycerol-3-phosphate acyltransferase [Phycisphaerales bacterium]|nr:1-acyl-sn-glycerol-3-phosphate acyltransferase [Phycisphaerales bacterium]MCI0631285.1 1-acyl-sn-glycerol-3-phosphate acyltransferase [Phycisphaerales bacterium]
MRVFQIRRRVPGRPALRVLFWWTFIRGVVWLFLAMVYRVRRSGAEHVPHTGPIVYVANHQSHYDPCIVGVLVTDRPFSGIARASLFKSKLLAWIMHGIGVVPIEQGKGDSGAIKVALDELAAGRCLLIFPEGSRTPDGALGEFQRGVMLLIKRSGATVVPVAIEGAFDIWPIGTNFPKLAGRIAVQAGPPISARELDQGNGKGGLERLKREIETIRLQLRAQLRRATRGCYPATGPGDAPYWEQNPESSDGR